MPPHVVVIVLTYLIVQRILGRRLYLVDRVIGGRRSGHGRQLLMILGLVVMVMVVMTRG